MNRFWSQGMFVSEAGARCVLWVKPSSVINFHGTKWQSTVRQRNLLRHRLIPKKLGGVAKRALVRFEWFVVPATNFRLGVPIEQTEKYKKISDFIENRDMPENSLWYRALIDDIQRSGFAVHKKVMMRCEREVLAFLEDYSENVVRSLEAFGFLDQYDGWESTGIIDAEGRVGKTGSGCHRFYIAKALGLDVFPLKIIGIHE